MASTLATTNQRTKVSRVRTKAIVLVLLLPAIYSGAGLSASQAQFAMMQSPDEGKGWKGLVPLRSTRRDVEALLGPPTPGGQSLYQTNEATVYVGYSDGPCEKGWPYGWNVDKDTVVSIVVSPKEPVMFTDLKIDKNKYRQTRDSHINSRMLYANQGEGITLTVDEITGKVKSFTYHPTDSQQKLQCPDAASRLPVGADQADPFFKFDAYGDLSPKLERERLDAVAAELLRRREADAYLIAYAGHVAYKGEASARAVCARNYLIKKHHIQADRIQAINGGYREMFEVEVYVEEKDGSIPLATPSVRPSKIKITQDTPVPTCRVNIEN
jgi:hypothetical protein